MGGFILPGLGNALANLAQDPSGGRSGRQGGGSPMSPTDIQKEKIINKYKAPAEIRKGGKY